MKKKKSTPEDIPKVGKTIQRLRHSSQLSLGDLAEKSGVSKSIISQIERNECNPTLSTIWRLSSALDIGMEEFLSIKENQIFFDPLTQNSTPIIKSEDGLCELRVLSPLQTVVWLQWYHLIIKPGGVLESDPHQQGSHEHITVLSGEITVTCGNDNQLAKPGQTLRYLCDQHHVLSNSGKEPAEAFMVLILKNPSTITT